MIITAAVLLLLSLLQVAVRQTISVSAFVSVVDTRRKIPTEAWTIQQPRSPSLTNSGKSTPTPPSSVLTVLHEGKNPMQRPLLDQIATTLFNLESQRVASSSVLDDQGRYGEPMEWSNRTSFANQFSVMMASNPIGYTFKQTVANLVAGSYNEAEVTSQIKSYIQQDTVVMFSFTTCPFCRKAKDILEERSIPYTAIELDALEEENEGNILRAQLGKLTKRTSMPNIFIHGKCIGGCNDGYPGLIPLIENDQLDAFILASPPSQYSQSKKNI